MAKNKNLYKVLYKLTHANGTLVDECQDQPLIFEIGDGQLDPCLESCVEEAQLNKWQTFVLMANEAFGDILDEAFQVMKRRDFPDDTVIEQNAAIEFQTPAGESYVGCIDNISGDDIRVNFNHPLAGCDVSFQVKVLDRS